MDIMVRDTNGNTLYRTEDALESYGAPTEVHVSDAGTLIVTVELDEDDA